MTEWDVLTADSVESLVDKSKATLTDVSVVIPIFNEEASLETTLS